MYANQSISFGTKNYSDFKSYNIIMILSDSFSGNIEKRSQEFQKLNLQIATLF